MSRAELKRIGAGNKFVPEEWQCRLADRLAIKHSERRAAMLVYAIFGTAVLRDAIPELGEEAGAKYIVLQDLVKQDLSRDYLSDLAAAIGIAVHLRAKPLFRKGSAGAKLITQDTEFSRECHRRIETMRARISEKGVQL